MPKLTPIQQIVHIAQQLNDAESEAFRLREDLHAAIQSALAMGNSEEDVRAAGNISERYLAMVKGPSIDELTGFKYRGSDPAMDYDDVYNVPIRRFKTLDDVDWSSFAPGSKTRIIIQPQPDILPIDVMYYPRENRRLIVAFHGAEDRRVLNPPKFQYMQSMTPREESLLFVSDSTLLTGPRINLGWMVGNKDLHVGAKVADLVNRIVDVQGHGETVLIGHSGGGYAAILVGSRIPNSRAISVNGQSVVTRYEPWTVTNLKNEAFPELDSIEEMARTYAERLDLRVVLPERVPSSSFTAFGNSTDQASFGRLPHFPLLAEHFGLGEEGGRTEEGDSLVACTWESTSPSGHALPGTIMPFLNLVLGEPHSLNIEMSADPLWVR